LDVEVARTKLSIKGHLDADTVKTAYINRVKEVRDNADFEKLLRELNVARDTLLESLEGSREIVPSLAKELTSISDKQNRFLQINDARNEIREVFGSLERRAISPLKGTRDLTGVLSAVSAALAFGKDNISEFLPSLTDSTLYSQTLFLLSAIFGFYAYMANQRSRHVSARLDEIKRTLTRDRQINRLLIHVFGEEDSLEEMNFEDRLQTEINAVLGVSGKPSAFQVGLEVYGALGFPVPVKIRLGRDFIDDYIDYLVKSGYIKATGVSGRDMIFHKEN